MQAYVALTLMVALSFNPLRKRYYEAFYYSHCMLVVVFLIGCIVHYEPLWGWATLAIALWGAERGSRLLVWLWINGFFGLSPVGLWRFWSEAEGRKVMRSWKRASDSSLHADRPSLQANLPPQVFGSASRYANRAQTTHQAHADAWHSPSLSEPDGDASTLVDSRAEPVQSPWPQRQSLYAYGFADSPAPTPYLAQYPPRDDYTSTPQLTSPSHDRLAAHDPHTPLDHAPIALRPPASATQSRAPPGFAFVQSLPGRSLRLTINTPRRMRWRSGQNVLINVPSVAWWQTHPYTIVNANVDRNAEENGSEVVILLRARRGFTRALYDKVAAERRDLEARMGAEAASRANGVLLRAMVSHPMGSAGRNRWQWYSTVILICGGSGVAFGMGVLEELCSRMANLDSKGGQRGNTTRVRFVWIIREYGELCLRLPIWLR
ncbi:MAG: NADPH oxidase family protein [Terriglobus roseus]|nr:NADPH oxidase family protein [Terriglobus roseus]